MGARRLRHDALAADRAGARRVPAAPLHPRLRPRGGHRDALAGEARRRRGSATAARSTLGVTFATRIFGSISGRLALAVEDGRRRHAGHRLAPGAGLPRPAERRAARARDHDAAARGDRGARRHDHRPRRGAPVRARAAGLRDRRPGRPGAARARGGAGAPRHPRGHARGPDGARAHVRGAARRQARRHAEGGRPRARPQRAGRPAPRSAPRSTRRSRRRRSPRSPAASAGSR